jgi:hypothetical protein
MSEYLNSVIKASGGAGAPAELLDPSKIKQPKDYSSLAAKDEKYILDSLDAAGYLVPEEQDLADALLEIVDKYGKFNDDNTGVWAGYTSAKDNVENAAIGVKCGSCVFWQAPNGCQIIVAETEEGGLCRFAVLPDGAVTATAGSKPAPKKDRIYGSKKNKKGSAKSGGSVKFSKKVEESLAEKVRNHNKKASDGRKTSIRTLKAVYRRGAGAFSSSHRPDQNRNSWAMARVNAFLHLLKSGTPKNSKYTTDNDLLPASHPRSSKGEAAITAAAFDSYLDSQLSVAILDETEYASPDHAIFSLAEFSSLGYEALPAIKAAWLRGVREEGSGFERAKDLALNLYDGRDSDLLPNKEALDELF